MDEYIEREAVRSKAVYMHGFGQNKYVPLRAIEEAPAADVAPVVHGRWVPFEHWVHKTFWRGKACSVCNANIGHKTVFKFCPNCGARMRGNEDE